VLSTFTSKQLNHFSKYLAANSAISQAIDQLKQKKEKRIAWEQRKQEDDTYAERKARREACATKYESDTQTRRKRALERINNARYGERILSEAEVQAMIHCS
jgi:uncharacterized protein YgiB involved in biofilm formation